MSKGRKKGSQLQTLLSLAAVSAVLLPVFLLSSPWPAAARDYLELHGVQETGAINLVSAIYLGYRAFDTLGETIVLLTAVSGTIGILSRAGASLAEGYRSSEETLSIAEASESESASVPAAEPDLGSDPGEKALRTEETHTKHRKHKPRRLRTHLLEVVTGTLSPVVLMFGFYVMLYGHLSPGGGFQGGVVIASGIVFLALGNRKESSTKITQASVLGRIEAAAFLMLILISVSGIIQGGGFLDNPLGESVILPAGFIILLNAVIGLKVGAGIGFMCIALLGKENS
ncbi:MAG: hypothetical protein K9K78_08320 [Spirochaetales bacterium]|nr:hypothetical protein [Spirochaetales bacterium]